MHSTRVLVVAMLGSAILGLAFHPTMSVASSNDPAERVARSIEKISDQLKELTRAVQSSDRAVECRCK